MGEERSERPAGSVEIPQVETEFPTLIFNEMPTKCPPPFRDDPETCLKPGKGALRFITTITVTLSSRLRSVDQILLGKQAKRGFFPALCFKRSHSYRSGDARFSKKLSQNRAKNEAREATTAGIDRLGEIVGEVSCAGERREVRSGPASTGLPLHLTPIAPLAQSQIPWPPHNQGFPYAPVRAAPLPFARRHTTSQIRKPTEVTTPAR
jgi:hypothetical protein